MSLICDIVNEYSVICYITDRKKGKLKFPLGIGQFGNKNNE